MHYSWLGFWELGSTLWVDCAQLHCPNLQQASATCFYSVMVKAEKLEIEKKISNTSRPRLATVILSLPLRCIDHRKSLVQVKFKEQDSSIS